MELQGNYSDIGTHLNFCQENDIGRCCNVNTRSKIRRKKPNVVTTLVLGCSNDVGNATL